MVAVIVMCFVLVFLARLAGCVPCVVVRLRWRIIGRERGVSLWRRGRMRTIRVSAGLCVSGAMIGIRLRGVLRGGGENFLRGGIGKKFKRVFRRGDFFQKIRPAPPPQAVGRLLGRFLANSRC